MTSENVVLTEAGIGVTRGRQARRSRAGRGTGRAQRRRTLLGGTQLVWLLTLAIAAVGALAYALPISHLRPLDTNLSAAPEWALVVGLSVLFFAVETYVVHLEFRRDAHSFSFTEIPLVLGLFFVSPMGLLAAQLAGGGAALLRRRQSPLKFTFNLSMLMLNAAAATLIFHALVPRDDAMGPGGWLAALAATTATGIIGPSLINLAIGLSQRGMPSNMWSRVLGISIVLNVTSTTLGLAGAALVWFDWRTTWLLLLPVVALAIVSRAYAAERQKHQSVELLCESTNIMHRSLEMETATRALLSQAREMFRAEIAEIVFFPQADGHEAASRTTLGPGDRLNAHERFDLDLDEDGWARAASEGRAVRISRPIDDDDARARLSERGIRDAMIAPVYGDSQVVGTIMVANRLGNVSTFDREDLKLFEALANHASVSLENARLVGRLESALAYQTEMNRLKEDFVAAVSHELRTPLTSIQGYVKTLLRAEVRLDGGRQKSFLEEVERQSDRLRRLIEDLLAVSRLESGQETSSLRTFSVADVAREVADEVRPAGDERPIDVRFEEHAAVVESDADKVRQILTNLLDNAVKYTPAGTPVSIAGRVEGGSAVISVIDHGHGIPAEQQERIFDRFYQVDQSSTRAVGGTGLGLYICRKLADALGGHVWLERSDHRGSVFCLRMPLSREVDSAHPMAASVGDPSSN